MFLQCPEHSLIEMQTRPEMVPKEEHIKGKKEWPGAKNLELVL